jgi:gamma-glutamylcyclotransferase (GGCT)/AIG2-like uncharacterized protein YtfP
MLEHLPIFVYGTLKRGQCREPLWPHRPLEIREATLRAALYDLGPYPAIGPGDDLIAGELWFLRADHIEKTLRVLDRVEGFNQAGKTNWYERQIVECRDAHGEVHRAYTYFFADEEKLNGAQRVLVGEDQKCRWPAQG